MSSVRTQIKSLRISEKNRLNNLIKENKSFRSINENTIQRFKKGPVSNDLQISKLEQKNEELSKIIDELSKRYDDVQEGLLDEELEYITNNAKNEIKKKNKEKQIKKVEAKEELKKKKEISQQYYNNERSLDSKNRFMKNSDKYFYKVCESIPEYLQNKLNNMPETKGYLFRGVCLYGKKKVPEHKRTSTILFEYNKKRFFIHEWNKKTGLYTKHEKVNNKHILIEEYPISLINHK